ncbi:hypothetical protein D1818_24350 [Aquimarina sp. BL5]|uniref:hypothetical protein n=1 Tax=Aquimarina sp. BL5 TaxID=1714860 RepID=UPI000E5442F1|nr:hypothetical protein [Aquimarina sp. BL5]AXT53798.1 hypothetical protein D1818_24350 [Aquimarina sp. BL5]
MKTYKKHTIILILFFLHGLNSSAQTDIEEKEDLITILKNNEWFCHQKFLLDTTIRKYDLIAIESKEQFRDSLGAPIVGFYKDRFASYENIPRCGNDPSTDSSIYGTYKIFDKKNIKVEINVPVGNEIIILDNGSFVPKQTKKSTFFFKIMINGENKISLEKM